jgi:hypothetical protein
MAQDAIGEPGRPSSPPGSARSADILVLKTIIPLESPSRKNKKGPVSRAFLHGRYWARTSDPQLVELVPPPLRATTNPDERPQPCGFASAPWRTDGLAARADLRTFGPGLGHELERDTVGPVPSTAATRRQKEERNEPHDRDSRPREGRLLRQRAHVHAAQKRRVKSSVVGISAEVDPAGSHERGYGDDNEGDCEHAECIVDQSKKQ